MDAEQKELYGQVLVFANDIITALETNNIKPPGNKFGSLLLVVSDMDKDGKPSSKPVGGSINWTDGKWRLYNEAAEIVPLTAAEIKALDEKTI